jgi:hypothetical protein
MWYVIEVSALFVRFAKSDAEDSRNIRLMTGTGNISAQAVPRALNNFTFCEFVSFMTYLEFQPKIRDVNTTISCGFILRHVICFLSD